MTNKLPYDETSPRSIEKYAQQLVGQSLSDYLGNVKQQYKGKGRLGQLLEKLFFQYEPNSSSEPDFEKAKVELKTTPLKKTSKGLVSKERLVFNIIDYCEEYKHEFKDSSFWKKNQLLLLMFYLHEKEKLDIDYLFKIVRLWQFPPTDLKIIKDDWAKIIEKIKAGKAHELSEGDTLYLGACTKGASSKTKRKQPFSHEEAMQRAFSLKSKYLNYIIKSSFAKERIEIDYCEYDKILGVKNSNKNHYSTLVPNTHEAIVKSVYEYNPNETFEDLVIKRFTPFYGKSEDEIRKHFKLNKSSAKSKFFLLAKAILGVKNDKIEEFEKADLVMKTIRLESSGSLKESMSFAQIKFTEIINESWLDSYWHDTLTKRFFFVVFQKDANNTLRLKKVMFWTMPANDLEVAKAFWLDTKRKIKADDYKHFIKISDNKICHVRPKGANAKDKMLTPTGRKESKKCYWLNARYIKKIIQ